MLEQYGVHADNIRAMLPNVLLGGLDNGPRVAEVLVDKAPSAIPTAARTSLVLATLELVKAAAATQAVQARLVEAAAGEPPRDPREEFRALDIDFAQKREELQGLDLTQVPAAQRADVEKLRAQSLASMKQMLDGKRAQLPEATKRYEADLSAWEKSKQPGDVLVTAALRKVLGEFLTGTADMRWGARLVKQHGQQVFADPRLEARPSWWKACFRAGKEPVDAARTYATKWLAELK